jgi:molybdopterin biosynthesis enzyme MoaB
MMSHGLEATPMAALSRARAGSIGSTLVVNLPGSSKGALESLEAVAEVIPHALDLLVGDTEHR